MAQAQMDKEYGSRLAAWHALSATWLGGMFDGFDASIMVLVLFPALSELMSTGQHSTVGVVGSVVLAVFMLGWACGAIVFGTLADYIGRTRTMVLTILLYAICTGLCATAHNWGELAFYRFLVGAGIGGEISIGAVLLSEVWKGNARTHAIATMCTSFGVGYILAAAANLWLGHFGWRWLFVVGVLPAFITLYIRARLKEPEQFKQIQDYKRHLKTKSQEAMTEAEKSYLRFTFPLLFNSENRKKTIVVIALASTAIIGYWASLSWVPAWINQLTGTLAVNERSIAAIFMNIGAVTCAAFGGFIVNRLGRVNAFRLGFMGALLSCAGMFLTVKSFGPALLAWVFFAGAFATMPFVFLFVYVPELFQANLRGTAFGFSVQLGRIFAALAAIGGGQLIAMFGGSYAVAGATVAGLYVVGIIASFFMPETQGEVSTGLHVRVLSELKGVSASAGDLVAAPVRAAISVRRES